MNDAGRPGWTILAVDDMPANLSLLAGLLGEQYRVKVATSGAKGLELALSSPPDLILLDVMMPGLSGYEVLERVRSDARLRHIPVIMISAVDEMSSVIRCIELGAEDYLPKPFDPTLLRARVGASLEKKGLRDEIARHVRRMERELETARTIQLSMVPTEFPKASADRPVAVHARLQPALEIGGDLYDCFWLDDDYLCLVVADVSDKGASAGLYMARTKTVIRLMAKTLGRNAGAASSVAELLGEVNNELCRDNPHAMFATICICVLNARTGAVVCCNAGHDAPYLIGADGSTARLFAAGSLPAGIEPDQIYAAEAREIPPGSTLFVYTDGITEAMNEHREQFGVARLEAALQACAGQAPDTLVNATLEKVQAFAGAAPPSDDIAALACRWG